MSQFDSMRHRETRLAWRNPALGALALIIGTACTESRQPQAPITAPASGVSRSVAAAPPSWKHIAFDLQLDGGTSAAARPPIRMHVEHDNVSEPSGKTVLTVLPSPAASLVFVGNRAVTGLEFGPTTERSRVLRRDGTEFPAGEIASSVMGFDPERSMPDSIRRLRDLARSRPRQTNAQRSSAWIDGLIVPAGYAAVVKARLSRVAAPVTDSSGRLHYTLTKNARVIDVVVDDAVGDVVASTLTENGKLIGRMTYEHQRLGSDRMLRSKITMERVMGRNTLTSSMSVANVTLDGGGH